MRKVTKLRKQWAAPPQHCQEGASQFSAIYARRTTAPQGAAHQLKVRSQGSLLVPSCQFGGYAANPSFIIHHSSLAYGPVDACSCFCEADALPGGFYREDAIGDELAESRSKATGKGKRG